MPLSTLNVWLKIILHFENVGIIDSTTTKHPNDEEEQFNEKTTYKKAFLRTFHKKSPLSRKFEYQQ